MQKDFEESQNAWNICRTRKIFRDTTKINYYSTPQKPFEKKFAPIDIDGLRYRQNLETGEVTNYTKELALNTLAISVRRTRMLIDYLLKMNDFDWFVTLTFSDEDCKMFNGTRKDFKTVCILYERFVDKITHQFPYMTYITFPELHKDYESWHFHMLIGGGIKPKDLGFVYSGKVCCSWATKKNFICSEEYYNKTKDAHELTCTDGCRIYNITKFPYGFSTASKVMSRERCNTYVKKYVEKALGCTDLFKKRFFYSKNLNRPELIKDTLFCGVIGMGDIRANDIVHYDKYNKLQDIASEEDLLYTYKNDDYNVYSLEYKNEFLNNFENDTLPIQNGNVYLGQSSLFDEKDKFKNEIKESFDFDCPREDPYFDKSMFNSYDEYLSYIYEN